MIVTKDKAQYKSASLTGNYTASVSEATCSYEYSVANADSTLSMSKYSSRDEYKSMIRPGQ